MTYSLRYDLMTSDQVPATVIAEWILEDPLFARYVASRRQCSSAGAGSGNRTRTASLGS